ncbi:MAG: chalcone isomerase family protein, partial [Pseudomonadota bacterium]
FLLLGAAPVQANEYIATYVPNAQKVGEGRLKYLMWDVYDAALYAPKGTLDQDKPFAIEISYLREITGKKIADRSAVEIKNQGVADPQTVEAWRNKMTEIFPDVDKGVKLTGIYDKNGEAIFYKNNQKIGKIEDKEFSKAFFNIWLDKNTSSPDLRRKLLGSL